MSELQAWLIGIGALIIIAVFAYNKIQESRIRKRAEAAFDRGHEDVLLDKPAPGGRPADGVAGADLDEIDRGSLEVTPAVGTVQSAPGSEAKVEHSLGLPSIAALPAGPGAVLDPRADLIAVFLLAEPLQGEQVLRHAEALLADAPKQTLWEGLDEAANRWQALSPAKRFSATRVGLQLVDRRGRISEQDFNAFCAKLQELAVTLPGELHLPSRAETLRSAEQMDRFCSEVDMQIGLNIIRPDGARLASGRVRQLAESMGCVLDRDGRFRKEGPGGSELYSIANLDPVPLTGDPGQSSTTSGVTVVLDVPRAPPTEEVFSGFREIAMALAKSLDARLVDDNRQPISAAALQSIVAEIAKSRERMRAEGIVPGGPLAQRLFY